MNESSIALTIESLFNDLKTDKAEGILVHCADWGTNVRLTINDILVEMDIQSNWDGFEVSIIDGADTQHFQIDELPDLLQILNLS